MSIIKLNNQAVKNATSFGSISSLGSMTFIKKLTASSSATLSFVDGSDGVVLDDTYKEYLFTYNNVHGATDGANFEFNMSTDGGLNYNVVKTTTFFQSFNLENNTNSGLTYRTGDDLAQSTNFQKIITDIGNENDENGSGYMQLFNPSSDTFVKHFIANGSTVLASPGNSNRFCSGYGNTTSAINGIRFQMDSGNIDAGDICLYGIA